MRQLSGRGYKSWLESQTACCGCCALGHLTRPKFQFGKRQESLGSRMLRRESSSLIPSLVVFTCKSRLWHTFSLIRLSTTVDLSQHTLPPHLTRIPLMAWTRTSGKNTFIIDRMCTLFPSAFWGADMWPDLSICITGKCSMYRQILAFCQAHRVVHSQY